MQILPSETAGGRLGGILGNALQELAAAKVADLQRQYEQQLPSMRFRQAAEPLLGKRVSRFVGSLDPKLQASALQNIPALMELAKILDQQEAAQPSGGINELMQGAPGDKKQIPTRGLETLTQQLTPESMPQSGIDSERQVQQLVPSAQDPRQRISELLSESFTSPKERREREAAKLKQEELELKRQKEERYKQADQFAQEQRLKPFLDKEQAQFQLDRKVAQKAEKALSLLKKYGNKFPSTLTSILPQQAQALLIRHPGVRDYAAIINDIVKDLAAVERGPLTRARIQLTEAAKANFTQPLATQEEVLQRLIDNRSESSQRQKYLASLKDPKTGYHPKDTESRYVEFLQAQDYPLDYPQYYTDGTIIEVDGIRYRNRDKKEWEPLGE